MSGFELIVVGNGDSVNVDIIDFNYSGPLGTYTDEGILNANATWNIAFSGIDDGNSFSFELVNTSSQWEFDSSGTSSFTATTDKLFISADADADIFGYTNLVGEPINPSIHLSNSVDFSLFGGFGDPYFRAFDVFNLENLNTEKLPLAQSVTSSNSPIIFSRLQTVTDRGDAIGDNFSDSLFGDAGDNRLLGKGGDDLLDGGLGQDKYVGGLGADTFVIRVGEGLDTIRDFRLWQGDKIALGSGLSYDDLTISRFGRDGARLSFNGQDLAIVQADRFGAINESAFTMI